MRKQNTATYTTLSTFAFFKEEIPKDFEEGEGPTDIPLSFTGDGKITHMQLDGKISPAQLKEAVEMARESAKEIHKIQVKALKDSVEGDKK